MIRIATSFQESQPRLRGESVSSAASAYTIHWLLPHNLCCPTPLTSTIANTRNRNSSANNPAVNCPSSPRQNVYIRSSASSLLPSILLRKSTWLDGASSLSNQPLNILPPSINTPTTRCQLAISAAMSSSIGNSLPCSRKLSFLYKTFYKRRRSPLLRAVGA